jgi:2-polyprenyl-6-methoxyphenol hydroxylase-like FAD-dependent oxidoreductase
MGRDTYRVLVIGAGIAGLAAARVLSTRVGHVEVVERGPNRAEDGFGIYLPGNATRAFDRLGLGDAVAGAAVHITHQRFLDHRGRLLGEVDVDDAWRGVGPCRAMPRSALHRVLLDGAAGVPIRWGVAAGAVAEAGDGVVVSFDDATEERYDLVVAADGVH